MNSKQMLGTAQKALGLDMLWQSKQQDDQLIIISENSKDWKGKFVRDKKGVGEDGSMPILGGKQGGT